MFLCNEQGLRTVSDTRFRKANLCNACRHS